MINKYKILLLNSISYGFGISKSREDIQVTDGQGDSMTNSAARGQVGENSDKFR